MTDGLSYGRAFYAAVGLIALLLCLGVVRNLPAQGTPADPVERLRVVLLTTTDVSPREQKLRECVEALHGVGELRRALALPEWQDRTPESGLAAIDRAQRKVVADRLLGAFRDMLRRPEPAAVNLALDLLVEMAAEERAKADPTGLPRALAPEVIALVKDGASGGAGRSRLPAAKALGLIDPDPAAATPVLGDLFLAADPHLHTAAAEGLANLLQAAVESASPAGREPQLRLERPAAERRAAVVLANTILSKLPAGYDDAQADVRRRCLAATLRAATRLYELLSEAPATEGDDAGRRVERARLEAERADLRPLLLGMRDQLPHLAKALRDEDVDARLTALATLEVLARVRWRWVRQGVWLGGEAGAGADDPLDDGMRAVLPPLAQALTDEAARVRRAALDVLDAFGPAAAPAAPAVDRALTDGDRFVRWSAIRALQSIGAPAALPAVPALARLLDDVDADVARAALDAVVRLDPTGRGVPPHGNKKYAPNRSAVPALARAVTARDADLRVAAVHALAGMGDNARPAVPALAGALGDPEVRVRQAAAAALGELGPAARDAVPDLNLALKDSDAAVRRAAGDALLRIRRAVEP